MEQFKKKACVIPEGKGHLLYCPKNMNFRKVFHHHELQNIISGNESVKFGALIQSMARFLQGKEEAIPEAERVE